MSYKNRLGSRVVGKKVAEATSVQKRYHSRLGTRVIGDVLARKHEIARGDTPPEKPVAEKEAPVVEAPITANLTELEEALKGNPTFFDALYESEKARADGPRKGALRLFLAHLNSQDAADGLVIEEIEGLLAS